MVGRWRASASGSEWYTAGAMRTAEAKVGGCEVAFGVEQHPTHARFHLGAA